jgi:uncharacterized membrane protein
MKRTIITLTVVVAAFVLGMMFGGSKVQTFNSSAAIAAPAPAPMAVPVPNRCPRIHEAIETLDHTLEELNSAGHDFCGHKREAMEKVREARRELHEAEGCDKCR